MSRTAPTILGAFLLVACAQSPQMNLAPSATSVEAELIALDQAWIEAEVQRDVAGLERILDQDFLCTLSSGVTVDRSSFIELITKSTILPFEVIHDAIRIHDDTALVIDLSSDRSIKYSWIAVRRDGRWRVISETISKTGSAS